jgi:hypothetical protein
MHYVPDLSEHPHATQPVLNVLTQSTECDEPGAVVRLWTPVYLVLVYRALQVLVEPRERIERLVAQQTLERHRQHVPRAFRRPRHRVRGRLVAAQWTQEQARGVRDVVVRVGADDEPVELFACHEGFACARFEVGHQCGMRDEGPVAATAWAPCVGRSELRVEVVAAVVLTLEGPPAVGAVGVPIRIVFLELCVAPECLHVAAAGSVVVCRHMWSEGGGIYNMRRPHATDLEAGPV